MIGRSIRWRLSRAVRSALEGAGAGSAPISAYRALRRVPGVRRLWRLIDRTAHVRFTDVEAYAEAGGSFAGSDGVASGGSAQARPSSRLPPVVEFDHPDFFPSLFARIDATRASPVQADEAVVLVNNGLSAGGAERQILATLAGLKARGTEAIFIGEKLIGPPGQDFHLPAARAAGLDVRQLERRAGPGLDLYQGVTRPVAEQLSTMPPSMLLEILDMARVLAAIRPRVLHLWQDETSIKHAVSGLIAGVERIILSGRNVNPTNFVFHQPYMLPGYRALAHRREIVFSNNSHAGAKSYADWIGIGVDRFTVIHNGFDASGQAGSAKAERARVRAALGAGPEDILVLGVFRLSPEKRPLLWLETAARTLEQVACARFAVCGEGPMQAVVEARIAELGLSDRVLLAGARADIADVYRAGDLLLLTSENEGLPNVLLEAQWHGLAVAATVAGGSAEAVQHGVTGMTSASADPQTLADLVAAMAGDTALRTSAREHGQAFVEARFGRERMIDETLALYAGAASPAEAGAMGGP